MYFVLTALRYTRAHVVYTALDNRRRRDRGRRNETVLFANHTITTPSAPRPVVIPCHYRPYGFNSLFLSYAIISTARYDCSSDSKQQQQQQQHYGVVVVYRFDTRPEETYSVTTAVVIVTIIYF